MKHTVGAAFIIIFYDYYYYFFFFFGGWLGIIILGHALPPFRLAFLSSFFRTEFDSSTGVPRYLRGLRSQNIPLKPQITRDHCFGILLYIFAIKKAKSMDNREKNLLITNSVHYEQAAISQNHE